MKKKTRNLSRFRVALFAVLLWQSSLGTKAEIIEAKNLGQNGYKKYSDGMLFQWGYSSTTSASKSIYLPISFYDTNYIVNVSIKKISSTGSDLSISAFPSSTYTSYFTVIGKAVSSDNTGPATEPVYWTAIGRWK